MACVCDNLQSTGLANRTGLLRRPPHFHSGNKGCRETGGGERDDASVAPSALELQMVIQESALR